MSRWKCLAILYAHAPAYAQGDVLAAGEWPLLTFGGGHDGVEQPLGGAQQLFALACPFGCQLAHTTRRSPG